MKVQIAIRGSHKSSSHAPNPEGALPQGAMAWA